MLSHGVARLYADHFPSGGAMAAGLVAFAIMFGMCGARLNFVIPCSALISLCVTLSVDPALPYSLIRVADAEDHRDRGRSSRARHKACCGAEPMVRIHLPPAKSRANDGHRCDLVANSDPGLASLAEICARLGVSKTPGWRSAH